ncbi:hypothetical protein VP1G_02918 [Cytospora mali]|uniref:Uncharacterized protein n=1 Tax=Cytospora mali TaxID=578113 RepID=A0A194UV14_CYTMA|nr:hypothetical protein VP1G_02918 [Valsa mali var. pyri (nom. inval.)]
MIVAVRAQRSINCWFWNSWSDPSETTRHYYNVLLAIGFFFIAQFLTCAWDQPFWATGLNFPGQIAAMLFVWLVMWASQIAFCKPGEGLEWFYRRYLRAPTEVLNKHMSIGFTIPFLDLIGQSFAGADQVGLLTAAFLVTGILNSVLVYFIAYHVQLTITKFTSQPRHIDVLDVEAPSPERSALVKAPRSLAGSHATIVSIGVHGIYENCGESDASRADRSRKYASDVSTLCTHTAYMGDSNEPKQTYMGEERGISTPDYAREQNEDDLQPSSCDLGPTRSSGASSLASQLAKVPGAVQSWMSHNVFLILSILLFLLVGLPISFLRGNDLCLDVGFLFTVWLTFTSAQTRTKQHINLGNHQYEKALTAIATLLNPVLWTSIFLVAYGLAKAGIRTQPASEIVATFTTNNSFSNVMGQHIDSSKSAIPSSSHLGHIPIGAGDIATSILNAGIVSWGLRLFEYRGQIVSRGGLTVIVTSLLASLFNVVVWPLLANAMGVRPASSDLSFAARSVTIALGGPVMKSLGGDAGVNAIGVVVNGICFQLVAGLFSGGIHVGGIGGVLNRCKYLLSHDGLVWNGRWTTQDRGSRYPSGSMSPPDNEQGRPCVIRRTQQRNDEDSNGTRRYSSDATQIENQRLPQPSLSPPVRAHEGQDAPMPANSTMHYSSNICSNGPKCGDKSRAEERDLDERNPDDVQTVAAGVTIGINAAAMGTAHLYEQNSHSAPYSALSMTTFGVFTVLFAVRNPLTEWLVGEVGGV